MAPAANNLTPGQLLDMMNAINGQPAQQQGRRVVQHAPAANVEVREVIKEVPIEVIKEVPVEVIKFVDKEVRVVLAWRGRGVGVGG